MKLSEVNTTRFSAAETRRGAIVQWSYMERMFRSAFDSQGRGEVALWSYTKRMFRSAFDSQGHDLSRQISNIRQPRHARRTRKQGRVVQCFCTPIRNCVAVLSVCAICFAPQPAAAQTPAPEAQTPAPAPSGTENRQVEYTRWAVKTNTLLWVAGAPNLGAEFRLGRRFSLAASGAFAGGRLRDDYALQFNKVGAEIKWWPGRGAGAKQGAKQGAAERPFTGWSVGAWGTAGWRYDVQWVDGWQGNRFLAGGISGGYSLAIGRRLNLELSASPGWFHSPEARHYHGGGGELIWQQTRYNTGRFMFKCAVNLVWLPGGRRGTAAREAKTRTENQR